MDGATLELGGSDELGGAFEAYADGADRPLIFGTQGGFHVWLRARTAGVCPGAPVFTLRVFEDDTGDMVSYQRTPLPVVDEGGGAGSLRDAVPLILCPSPFDAQVADRAFRVSVEVVDDDGRTASADHRFVPRCDASVQGGSFVGDCRCLCAMEGC